MPKVFEPQVHKKKLKSGGPWYVYWAYQGDHGRKSLGTKDSREADYLLQLHRNAIRERHGFPPIGRSGGAVVAKKQDCLPGDDGSLGFTVEDALDLFEEKGLAFNLANDEMRSDKGQSHLKSKIKLLRSRQPLAGIDLSRLQKSAVQEFIQARLLEKAERRKGTVKRHTLAKDLSALRQALNFASDWPESPVHGRVAPSLGDAMVPTFRSHYRPRERWLTHEQYVALRDFLDAEERSVFAAASHKRWGTGEIKRSLWLTAGVYLGGRESELRGLCWEDIHFQGTGGWAVLRTAKAREALSVEERPTREVPFNQELRDALLAVRPAEARGPVFTKPWKNPALMLTRYARRAGVCGEDETLNDNDLRRTFATWMIECNWDRAGGSESLIWSVAQLLGHSSTAMVRKVYGRIQRHRLRAAADAMPVFPKGAMPSLAPPRNGLVLLSKTGG